MRIVLHIIYNRSTDIYKKYGSAEIIIYKYEKVISVQK